MQRKAYNPMRRSSFVVWVTTSCHVDVEALQTIRPQPTIFKGKSL